METVNLNIDANGNGHFFINENDRQVAEMQIGISGRDLSVYHTEVLPIAEGKGMAKELLSALVDYAKKNDLKVIALCPYVFAQFKRHPEKYEDIWKNKS